MKEGGYQPITDPPEKPPASVIKDPPVRGAEEEAAPMGRDAACSDPLCSYRAEIDSGYWVRAEELEKLQERLTRTIAYVENRIHPGSLYYKNLLANLTGDIQ